ncbi:MAG: V-type ATP synthase subunit F [Candidatus Micrarchaeota archaeon]
MKSNIIVLGDSPLVTGFTLAGISKSLMTNPDSFQKNLETILEDTTYGVIIVNSEMFGTIDWRLKKKLDNLAYPVIVQVADAKNPGKDENEEMRALIKRALGFDINKK